MTNENEILTIHKVKLVDGWEIIPSDTKEGLFMPEMWMVEENYPLINKEQQIILDMLRLFIPGEYGYYFGEIHGHDDPEDIPEFTDGKWSEVYYTPLDYYYESGEYNIIKTTATEDYIYYAISRHGCSMASALTEYVRIAKDEANYLGD